MPVLSFRQFVDDALFHPAWGYYATGAVRFGLGGHYDTYPLALAPLFGRMLAEYARRSWRRRGRPRRFEVCELGAGNGQLCLDTLGWVETRAARSPAWRRFRGALRYRIVERSPALVARQHAQLGPLADRVVWTRADCARRVPSGAPFTRHGLVFGNEVLDCFAPERVVPRRDGRPRATFVVPTLRGRMLSRTALARAMRARHRVRFRQLLRPVTDVRGLAPFLRRHYPEFFGTGRSWPPYFACPQLERFMANTRRLYDEAEAIWIDYGDTRAFHLTTPERRRFVAGPPRANASPYAAPGHDDLTVLVDFSVAETAAERAGWRTVFYGQQGALARLAGVRLDARAEALIVRYRALGWMLSVVGATPEGDWRRGALSWQRKGSTGERLRDTVHRDVDEFLGRRPTRFRMLVLASDRWPARRRA